MDDYLFVKVMTVGNYLIILFLMCKFFSTLSGNDKVSNKVF